MARWRTVEVWTILAMVLGKTDAQLVTGRWNEWQSTLDTLWESGCCLVQLPANLYDVILTANDTGMYQAHVKNTKDLTPKTFYDQSTVPQCDVTLWELVPTCVWTVVCELKPLPKDHSKAHMLWSNHVAMAVSLECLTTDSNIYTVVIENTEGIASRCVGTHAALSVQVTTKCDMRLTVIPQWSENTPILVLLYFVYWTFSPTKVLISSHKQLNSFLW